MNQSADPSLIDSAAVPHRTGPLGESATRLLQHAGPIFAEKGFQGATLREIANAAQTNVASVSYHFGDKLGLYRAVIAQMRSEREKRFPAPVIQTPPAGQPPMIVLRPIVQTILSRMLACDENGWQHRLMMREFQQPTVVFSQIVHEYFRPMFELMKSTLGQLMGPQADEATVHRMVFSLIGQCVYYRIGDPTIPHLLTPSQIDAVMDIDALADHICGVMSAAIESYRHGHFAGDAEPPHDSTQVSVETLPSDSSC
ncbi:CerR family C-terminal domain-containing protein [Crateriforma conspicua]|uniref:Putative DNA-binding transcriptional regulator n=1 Tax=Crateriforma conspicua TaxID=2527996 RepID=A0A5C5XYA4_9PLAN|nr:CerR family C-terminal domain-containing protein [Crateriforma conspicua]QDV63279.1 putative HTH-type transcriptional regulator YttP [Crateriforma conspicua]TWT67950.1 putative DNA-binding transcriptional regulator [Crateriforma conspicua]